VVFIFQEPFNNDKHFGVVQYIHQRHAIPITGQLDQSDHPPLYYVLASLFSRGDAKTVQGFSLLLSIGTLFVIYWLIKNLRFIQPLKIKKYCLLFACTLPQFIMFGNYISNDTLSFFIGALISLQIFLYINKPNWVRQNILALYLGLGLLTKSTFLLFIPALILLIGLINVRKKIGIKQNIISLLIFISIFTTLGSYKYIQNIIHWGRPVVMNLDARPPEFIVNQRPTYAGLKSIYDINIFKLCRHPTISEYTRHSYPLMLYGTFWYQFISESNFKGNMTKFRYLGSLIYILALLPTLLFFIGFSRILFSIKSALSRKKPDEPEFNKITYEAISLLLLFSNSLMTIYLGGKYDIWSLFQSRYLFPSFFSIIILFNSGLDYTGRRWAIAQKVVYPLLSCLYWAFILYFSVEIVRKL
jgi:4-amino-4-deoxy-L-arabinose transferase-like glycosyltransferase